MATESALSSIPRDVKFPLTVTALAKVAFPVDLPILRNSVLVPLTLRSKLKSPSVALCSILNP